MECLGLISAIAIAIYWNRYSRRLWRSIVGYSFSVHLPSRSPSGIRKLAPGPLQRTDLHILQWAADINRVQRVIGVV